MRVQVKLFATLQKYAPEPEASVFPLEMPERSTIADVMRTLGIPAGEVKIAYVNGRARATVYRLKDGDELGIFPPIGGG